MPSRIASGEPRARFSLREVDDVRAGVPSMNPSEDADVQQRGHPNPSISEP